MPTLTSDRIRLEVMSELIISQRKTAVSLHSTFRTFYINSVELKYGKNCHFCSYCLMFSVLQVSQGGHMVVGFTPICATSAYHH